ncbi:MAG: DUF413 domain-containing protein [Phycisphaerales bacterium]|nr:DUF413 domain-containing protein [Phycisphaerales bacterium]
MPSQYEYEQLKKLFKFECKLTNLSSNEIAQLEQYGWFLLGIELGHIKPSTPAQQHFFDVIEGHKEPETDFEVLWIDYRTQCKIDKLPYVARHDPGKNAYPTGSVTDSMLKWYEQ